MIVKTLPWMSEKVAGIPQQFDSGLLLKLQSQIGHFV